MERIVASSVQLQNVELAWIGREMRTTASTLSGWVYLTVLPTNSSIFTEQYTRATIKVELSKFGIGIHLNFWFQNQHCTRINGLKSVDSLLFQFLSTEKRHAHPAPAL